MMRPTTDAYHIAMALTRYGFVRTPCSGGGSDFVRIRPNGVHEILHRANHPEMPVHWEDLCSLSIRTEGDPYPDLRLYETLRDIVTALATAADPAVTLETLL